MKRNDIINKLKVHKTVYTPPIGLLRILHNDGLEMVFRTLRVCNSQYHKNASFHLQHIQLLHKRFESPALLPLSESVPLVNFLNVGL